MSKRQKILLSSALGIVFLVLIFMPKGSLLDRSMDEVDITDSAEVREIVYKYGIPVDDYHVDYGVVSKNQSLSTILVAHGLSGREILRLVESSKGVFDVRKIRPGQAYACFYPRDTTARMSFWVYEADPRSYVLFDLRDEYKTEVVNYPVEWIRKQAAGTVESSLWNAMSVAGSDPMLAVELSRIFGWTIDFFGLQKQDAFRVIYEQESIEGRELSNFRVLGAVFTQADSDYYAIPFFQSGEWMYFNEQGKSLEGAFLKAPLDFFRITSRFSNSRFHPVLKRYRSHHGVDYAAPVGTPVYAIGAGTVTARAYDRKGGGNYVKIKHANSYVTTYMHLSKFAKGLRVGQKVAQKETIGYVGNSGMSTGPHLDFRIHENGRPVNPLKIKSQPKEPVRPENRAEFTVLRDSVVKELRSLTPF
ncbi:MAG: peptidoglycan DD-metalloendopeptidase family protein [Culturomica sp.]|nr:peptidoglycan DD-metalloendopeptidase family protein [Culturomica sp.]